MPKQTVVTKAELHAALREPQGERDMAAILDRLPVYYERQYFYARPRRLRADFALWRPGRPPRFRLCLVECTGGIFSRQAHGSITGILADIGRLNAATLASWLMLRFTPDMISDGRAEELLERMCKL